MSQSNNNDEISDIFDELGNRIDGNREEADSSIKEEVDSFITTQFSSQSEEDSGSAIDQGDEESSSTSIEIKNTKMINTSAYKSTLMPQAYAALSSNDADKEEKHRSYLCVFNEIYYTSAYDALSEIKSWDSACRVIKNYLHTNKIVQSFHDGSTQFGIHDRLMEKLSDLYEQQSDWWDIYSDLPQAPILFVKDELAAIEVEEVDSEPRHHRRMEAVEDGFVIHHSKRLKLHLIIRRREFHGLHTNLRLQRHQVTLIRLGY
jgi:hypothetical protein